MAVFAEKIAPLTLRRHIATQIRDAVLRGMLRPGEKIVERDLAAQFGASLTAVREAVIQLEAEGLIVKRPNASTAIVELSAQDVLDIFAVRRELERYAFREAARRVTDAECRELEALHDDAIETAHSGDAEAYVQADMMWHQAVWRATKNSFLENAMQRVVVRLFGFSYIQLASTVGFSLVEDAASHTLLTRAICERDPDAAEVAFANAVEGWKDYALATTQCA
jgi:DNA-binding GntR family transcriptional regulator